MIIGEGKLEKLDTDKTSHEAGSGNNTNADVGDNSRTWIKIRVPVGYQREEMEI